jgi:tetratricopeptide (TPR) repeat protein
MADPSDLVRAAAQHARAGRAEEALGLIEQAQAAGPRSDALALKALVHLQRAEHEAAVAAADAAVALDPGNANAWSNRGSALQALGRRSAAVESFDRAVAANPRHVASLVNRGALLMGMRKLPEALASLERAAEISPDLPQVHTNRSQALVDLERFDEALAAADRALELNPRLAKGWTRRGDALFGLDRYEEALESYRSALEHGSGEYGWIGAAQALRSMGRSTEAVEAFDRAVAAAPASTMARYLRALAKFAAGDFAGGWDDYEVRWAYDGFYNGASGLVPAALRARLKLHPAREDLAGRRVLVLAEQGVGDQLMHASMLPDLVAVADAVDWVCDPRLHRLLSASFPSVRFHATAPAADGFDHVLASASLGRAFRPTAADFPGASFIRPTDEALARWGARLGPPRGRLRIGFAWRGGIQRTGRSRRSMSFDDLAPLLGREDLEFVSLQYGQVEADVRGAAAALGRELRVFPAVEIDDFDDAAAVVSHCDLVVSVQQTLVHLTGGLGRAGYIMVPRRPEWRYLAAGETMPWYRSIRLFRQGSSGDWAPVVADVVRALEARLAE